MREIFTHQVNPVNDKIKILVMDEPGNGGACHEYRIIVPKTGEAYQLEELLEKTEWADQLAIPFQNGGITDVGVNGLTQEVLLAIVIDRLKGFDSGEFRSRENSLALTKCEEALMWLHKRTLDRMDRGVEGKLEK